MYETRFALKRRPFPATPDTALYYPASAHEAALAELAQAIEQDQGFALLTGPAGTGKSLVGMCLVERLEENSVSAFLTNSRFPDRLSLLQALLYDFSLPYETGSEQVLRLRLTEFLLHNCQSGKRNLVVIDEAQHLQPDHLEELRLLGNLEAGGAKAFQVVLLGQPGLVELLRQPQQAALNQRLAVRAELEPLGVEESLDYLLHHLRIAGGRPEKIIDEASLDVLARGSKGVPRLLNQAAHQALLLADVAELPVVDAEAALEALTLLGLDADGDEQGDTLGVEIGLEGAHKDVPDEEHDELQDEMHDEEESDDEHPSEPIENMTVRIAEVTRRSA